MTPRGDLHNPFAITKATDFNDEQILKFWVQTPIPGDDKIALMRPNSPMPIFLLGGKGSGKTHLMRYHSFRLQSLRFKNSGFTLRQGVKDDGYVGIYLKCSGLNSGRFSGKRQTPDLWQEIFAYYVELWLARHVLQVGLDLELGKADHDEPDLCAAVTALFDVDTEQEVTKISMLINFIEGKQKELDVHINNCVISGKIDIPIIATRGKLVFGIPKIFRERYAFLTDVTFVYSIDEFESFSIQQQQFINSLVRDRELPSTFRIGARLYGVKTHETDGDQEENIQDSEFERIVLDEEFRKPGSKYSTFARRLVKQRFSAAAEDFESHAFRSKPPRDWVGSFATLDEGWESPMYLGMVRQMKSPERRHFDILREKFARANLSGIEEIISILSVPNHPLLEKINLLMFYRVLSDYKDYKCEARRIRSECRNFVDERNNSRGFGNVVNHYGSDMAAQLRRENRERHVYLGMRTFVAMSAGLPRALLTILRSVVDWSTYNGEDPLRSGKISIDSQYRGVKDASEWFFNSMRKAGEDGRVIQTAVDRLGQLFRVNRFADRPTECSLNSFSIAEHELSEETQRILRLSENRSFLIRISGGQYYKNSKQVHQKFQIHPMLCPRWQLPIGRGGTLPLSQDWAHSIFEIKRDGEFLDNLNAFRRRLTFSGLSKRAQGCSTVPRQQSLL